MAVGRANIMGDVGYIEDDGSWTMVNNLLINNFIISIGNIEIFIGFTAAAYGLPSGSSAFWPAHHPTDRDIGAQDGSGLTFSLELAGRNLDGLDVQSETGTIFLDEIHKSDFHFFQVVIYVEELEHTGWNV